MEVRDKIISGALKMFTRYGIRSITMDSIAEELGISKRTIYEKFKDKDELLKKCFETAIKTQKTSTEEILKSSENVIEALLKIVKHNVNIMKTINPVFFYDIKKYYPNLNKQTVENSDKQSLIQFMELLDRGKKENVFRPEINVEIVAILLFEQFKIMNNQEVFPEDKYSKIEIFENIVINFMRGIATEKGFSLIEKYNS
jgi:AcrR family transcriptional regulator